MREIKFRAWSERENKMFNVDVLAISECTWDCPDYGKRGVSLAYQPHLKVMQYTGLKDKNGKEIYEGDICKAEKFMFHDYNYDGSENFEDFIGAVTFDDSAWFVGHIPFMATAINSFEVIGNIYDNSELLVILNPQQ
jgi:uncharacterized phage protein (TIGR01671 family)